MTALTISKKQKRFLGVVVAFCEREGRCPTVRELGRQLDMTTSSVFGYLQALRRRRMVDAVPVAEGEPMLGHRYRPTAEAQAALAPQRRCCDAAGRLDEVAKLAARVAAGEFDGATITLAAVMLNTIGRSA